MSFSISISGTHKDAVLNVVGQAMVAQGSFEQAMRVGALASELAYSLPGTHVSGTVAGHFDGDDRKGSIGVSLTCTTEAPPALPIPEPKADAAPSSSAPATGG